MWKYLGSHGSIAIGVSALILLLSLIILLMFTPLQITLVPRLLPLSPRVKEPEKRPLKIREMLRACGQLAERQRTKQKEKTAYLIPKKQPSKRNKTNGQEIKRVPISTIENS